MAWGGWGEAGDHSTCTWATYSRVLLPGCDINPNRVEEGVFAEGGSSVYFTMNQMVSCGTSPSGGGGSDGGELWRCGGSLAALYLGLCRKT